MRQIKHKQDICNDKFQGIWCRLCDKTPVAFKYKQFVFSPPKLKLLLLDSNHNSSGNLSFIKADLFCFGGANR